MVNLWFVLVVWIPGIPFRYLINTMLDTFSEQKQKPELRV